MLLKGRYIFYQVKPFSLQHVDLDNSYLCGYLKIKGLTEEFPTLTTFFDGEIISKKHPFLTRKWDADEDVDRKHWVRETDESGKECRESPGRSLKYLKVEKGIFFLKIYLTWVAWILAKTKLVVTTDDRGIFEYFCKSREILIQTKHDFCTPVNDAILGGGIKF